MGIYLKPPSGKQLVKVTGRQLIADLKAQGWTEVDPPLCEPKKRPRRLYYTDHAFLQGF